MNNEIKFKKKYVVSAIFLSGMFLLPCILFIIYPEIFMHHFFAKSVYQSKFRITLKGEDFLKFLKQNLGASLYS